MQHRWVQLESWVPTFSSSNWIRPPAHYFLTSSQVMKPPVSANNTALNPKQTSVKVHYKTRQLFLKTGVGLTPTWTATLDLNRQQTGQIIAMTRTQTHGLMDRPDPTLGLWQTTKCNLWKCLNPNSPGYTTKQQKAQSSQSIPSLVSVILVTVCTGITLRQIGD